MIVAIKVALLLWVAFVSGENAADPSSCALLEDCYEDLSTFMSLEFPDFLTGKELEDYCKISHGGRNCIALHLSNTSCIEEEDYVTMHLMVLRSLKVTRILCNSRSREEFFGEEYSQVAECLDEHVDDISRCFHSNDMYYAPEEAMMRNTSTEEGWIYNTYCCRMQKYVNCAASAMEEKCGRGSRHTVTEMLLLVSGTHFREFCKSYDNTFPQYPGLCSAAISPKIALLVFGFYLVGRLMLRYVMF